MKKIIVIGSPGAGKSTFSRALAEKTGLPLHHLDRLWWNPGWVESEKEVFDKRLAEILTTERWIIDGNFNRTLPMRLDACDTVFYLDYPRRVCIRGVLSRVRKNRGISRPDMADGCPERFDMEFLRFVWGFNRQNRKRYHALLADCGKEVHILRSRKDAEQYLEALDAAVITHP